MGKIFNVKIRKTCKVCGNSLPKRFRVYCSKKCRNKEYGKRYAEYQKEWQRSQRGKYGIGKLKCKICGKWYIQIGSHVFHIHKMTAREYREMFNLPLKRGIVPRWYKKLKGKIALDNMTFLNLKKGKKYQFKKGDKRTKVVTGWKGRVYPPDDYYE